MKLSKPARAVVDKVKGTWHDASRQLSPDDFRDALEELTSIFEVEYESLKESEQQEGE